MLENEGENGAVDAEAVVLLENGEPVSATVVLPESDEETGGNTEEGKSDAVAIAEIHAETEIAVTAINADVEQARIEADRERNENWDAEREALQTSITALTSQVEELRMELSSAKAPPLNPTPQPELEEVAEAAEALADAIVPDESLTPPSTTESETVTELGQEEEAESAAVAVVTMEVPARKRRRLI